MTIRLDALPEEVKDIIAKNTLKARAPLGIENARMNLPHIEQSVLDLPAALPQLRDKVVVVASGPSLKRQNIVPRLKKIREKVTLVCCDGTLAACLREEVVPDIILSLDPHPYRIVRWLGDTKFDERPKDDYFQRQDLDTHFRDNERARNQEVIEMVNRYGKKICAALSTSVSPEVTRRCLESGMQIYWWNPLYDDWSQPGSYTRQVFELTRKEVPCMTGLGHGGGAAWVLAHAVLQSKLVAIVGMDLGYPDGTSVVNTQYYEFVRDLPMEQAERFLLRIENPQNGAMYLTDPVYYWYRESMIDAVQRADCTTYNCSGEGILFGNGVIWDTLENFADKSTV